MRKIKYDEFIRIQQKAEKKYTVIFFYQNYRYIILTDTVKVCPGEPYTVSEFYLELNPENILVHAVRSDRDNFNSPAKTFYLWGELIDNKLDSPINRNCLNNYEDLWGSQLVQPKMIINREIFYNKESMNKTRNL